MKSDRLQSAYRSCPAIVYLRVSTKKQQRSEFRNQTRAIKEAIPELLLTADTTTQLKEVMSGKASKDKRIGSKLGTLVRQMKRDPDVVVFVSNFDRIGRTTEVFEMIQTQGLGHRIFAMACKKNLDEMMVDGDHHRIVARTKAHDGRCQRGRERYTAEGGILGNLAIAEKSTKGGQIQAENAAARFEEVCSIIENHVRGHRGKAPPHQYIADELNMDGYRTGQGKLFTPDRVAQLVKGKTSRVNHAKDCYSRPRRRLRRLVALGRQQYLYNRIIAEKRAAPSPATSFATGFTPVFLPSPSFRPRIRFVRHWDTAQHYGNCGCRGPPHRLYAA